MGRELKFDVVAEDVAQDAVQTKEDNQKEEIQVEKTQVNVVEVAKGMSEDGFVQFVMDRKNGVTVPMLDEALKQPKAKEKKEVKARRIYQENKKLSSPETINHVVNKKQEVKMNKAFEEVIEENEEAVSRFLERVGSFRVKVEEIIMHDNPRTFSDAKGNKYASIGEVSMVIPPGFMLQKEWNNDLKEFIDVPFEELSFDGTRMVRPFAPLSGGSGQMTLNIVENITKGEIFVSLPKTKGKNGTKYEVFKTRDHRYGSYSGNHNGKFNAAITAFVQVMLQDFKEADPENRNGFKENCVNCMFSQMFQTKDGVHDDLEADDQFSTSIFQQLDILTLAQTGSEMPRLYCHAKGQFVDTKAVEEVNAAQAIDKIMVEGQDGIYRMQTDNQVIVGGRMVHMREERFNGRVVAKSFREEMTEPIAKECRYYHKNEMVSDQYIAQQKLQDPTAFVNRFFSEFVQANRLPVQTQVEGREGAYEWINAYPGEATSPLSFRVKGPGGVYVEGDDELMAYADPDFVAPVEAYRSEEAKYMKMIEKIFYVAFNWDTANEQLKNEVLDMVEEGIDLPDHLWYLAKRFETAQYWLLQNIEWKNEQRHYEELPPFKDSFFVGETEEAINIYENLLSKDNKDYQEERYEEFLDNPKEFVRYLGDSARDLALDVIQFGETFHVFTDEAQNNLDYYKEIVAKNKRHFKEAEDNVNKWKEELEKDEENRQVCVTRAMDQLIQARKTFETEKSELARSERKLAWAEEKYVDDLEEGNKDSYLVARALQEVVNQELYWMLKKMSKEDNPAQAIKSMNLHDDAKSYLLLNLYKG